MASESMREKIARALMKHYAEGGPWDGFTEADIVLDALMEPTDVMRDAGMSVISSGAVIWPADRHAFNATDNASRVVFSAMIRAAKDGA